MSNEASFFCHRNRQTSSERTSSASDKLARLITSSPYAYSIYCTSTCCSSCVHRTDTRLCTTGSYTLYTSIRYPYTSLLCD